MSTFLLGLALACLTFALGLVIWLGVRPPDRAIDLNRYPFTSTTERATP